MTHKRSFIPRTFLAGVLIALLAPVVGMAQQKADSKTGPAAGAQPVAAPGVLVVGVLADSPADKAGVARPVRFLSPEGKHVPKLEYRAIRAGGQWLAYVNNLDAKEPCQVKLSGETKFRGVRNLTLETDLPASFTLPGGETWILRLSE